MNCPKCGKENMWDNRESKKNPKAPDYKCRDANCDGVVWPPKYGKKEAPKADPRDMGPLLPNETAEIGDPPKEKSTKVYLAAMKFVVDTVVPVWEAGKIPYTASDINAATATIMIDHQRRLGR